MWVENVIYQPLDKKGIRHKKRLEHKMCGEEYVTIQHAFPLKH